MHFWSSFCALKYPPKQQVQYDLKQMKTHHVESNNKYVVDGAYT